MKTLRDTIYGILVNNEKYVKTVNEKKQVNLFAVKKDIISLDKDLLNILFSNNTIKDTFFIKIENNYIFNKEKFLEVLNTRLLDDSYTKYKNKVGLIDENGNFISDSNEVVLSYPYKDCVLEGGQEKEVDSDGKKVKRKEVFYNPLIAEKETKLMMAPKVFVNAKRWTQDGVEENIESFNYDNIIIKGNNLLALSSLLKRYEGMVKLIYIDPPFNTGNDSFSYNDNFSRSTWLTFMKNRLQIAKKLLSDDGNIFIHIDCNESHYLKVLMDEIFTENNFVEEIIWAYGSASGGRASTPKPVNIHDYILHYSKNYISRKQNRIYTPYSEKYIEDWFKYSDDDGRKYQKRQRGYNEKGEVVWERQYLDESKGIPLTTVWNDIKQVYANPMAYKKGNTSDVEVIKEFSGGQKPEKLIERIVEMSTDENDLVLDYHLGTGTTFATCIKLKRKCIGVEQLDNQVSIIIQRMQKVINGEQAGISKSVNWQGGGSFVYCELAKNNKQLIEDIENAKKNNDLDKF